MPRENGKLQVVVNSLGFAPFVKVVDYDNATDVNIPAILSKVKTNDYFSRQHIHYHNLQITIRLVSRSIRVILILQ